VTTTGAELWLELGPEFVGTLYGGRELKRKPRAWPLRSIRKLLPDACEIRGYEMLRHILNTEVIQVIPERKHREAFSLMLCIKAVVRTVLQYDLRAEVLIWTFV
jgi:hypothetical protein